MTVVGDNDVVLNFTLPKVWTSHPQLQRRAEKPFLGRASIASDN